MPTVVKKSFLLLLTFVSLTSCRTRPEGPSSNNLKDDSTLSEKASESTKGNKDTNKNSDHGKGDSTSIKQDDDTEYESSFTRDRNNYGKFTLEDSLKVDGVKLKNKKGEEIHLSGTNAGGYLVNESWMCAVSGDHINISNTFKRRFGQKKAVELWEYYRDNYWTKEDFQKCKDMGMNTIRLPFSYMSLDPDYYNVKKIKNQEFNFDVLDKFVYTASDYGLYTILDMHGAYGSQNGQQHSGQSLAQKQFDFYDNTEKKNKTKHLWEAIAEHFKDNPAIAGFDLLNEPNYKHNNLTKKEWGYFDELTKTIRAKDPNRIIIYEGWDDGSVLPMPNEYNWTNCMYSFHHYPMDDNRSTKNKDDYIPDFVYNGFKKNLEKILAKNFNVPLYAGEFNCYDYKESWERVMKLFEDNNINYTTWCFKVNGGNKYRYRDLTPFYHINATVVDANRTSYDDIKEAWKDIKTDSSKTIKTSFCIDNIATDKTETTYFDFFKNKEWNKKDTITNKLRLNNL